MPKARLVALEEQMVRMEMQLRAKRLVQDQQPRAKVQKGTLNPPKRGYQAGLSHAGTGVEVESADLCLHQLLACRKRTSPFNLHTCARMAEARLVALEGEMVRMELQLRVGQGQDKTRQDKTRQDKTRQDKTRQDKTRQDKTRQEITSVQPAWLMR